MNLYENSMAQEADEAPTEITREEYDEMRNGYTDIIQHSDSLKRLHADPDFTSVVIEGYLTNEVKRLANLMGSGRINEKTFNDCASQIKAVADFRSYLVLVLDQGRIASDELTGLEEAWNDALESGIVE